MYRHFIGGIDSDFDIWRCRKCDTKIICRIPIIKEHLQTHGILPPYTSILEEYFSFSGNSSSWKANEQQNKWLKDMQQGVK